MHGLYRMFLGDARPHSVNDEWVFSDVDSIQETIIPAARIALKVHQVPTASLSAVLIHLKTLTNGGVFTFQYDNVHV